MDISRLEPPPISTARQANLITQHSSLYHSVERNNPAVPADLPPLETVHSSDIQEVQTEEDLELAAAIQLSLGK